MEAIEAFGGKSYFVGGFVRDKILGRESKDMDIEVYGLEAAELQSVLNTFSPTSICGKSFGVFKLSYENQEYDFSLPRTDFQAGEKHNDIEVQTNPHLDMKTASSRRDLTINSLLMDLEGNIIDLHGGIEDLKNNALRATSDAFSDDPLRALRAARFSAVFNLIPDERILFLSRMMLEKVSTLPISRVQGEWVKIAQSSYPIRALDFLEKSGLMQIPFFPHFDMMQYTPQDKMFHPEGTVFQHTKHVCQAMAEICDRENITGKRRNILFFSALLHDVGKPHTTILKNGRWASPRHDKAGVSISELFLERYLELFSLVNIVPKLVSEHMVHLNLKQVKNKEKFVRKLAARLDKASIKDLALLIEADMSGRPPLPKHIPDSVVEILEIARKLGVNEKPEERKISGQDLIDLGFAPGKHFKEMLDFAYDIQMNGFEKDKILKQVKGRFHNEKIQKGNVAESS